MPRGVYDRSKSKAQRAAEKKTAAPAKTKTAAAPAKRKYTKRADKTATKVNTEKVATLGAQNWFGLSEARQNIAVLTECARLFSDIPEIKTEVAANVALLTRLREEAFPTASEAEETVEVEEPAPVKASSNGVAQGIIPLPPAPAPLPVPPAPTQS